MCIRLFQAGLRFGGVARLEVGPATDTIARMNLEEAVDAWTNWTSRQR